MEELTGLPGVGRKTANLILGDVFGQPAYVCDTHCIRITGRLGITDGSKDPLQVERQLRERIPPLPQVRGLPPGKGLRHRQSRQTGLTALESLWNFTCLRNAQARFFVFPHILR